MHKDFAEWYRSAGIQPNGDDLPKRWAGIMEYGAGRAEVISLATMFYEISAPTADFLAGFQAVLQKADPLIRMRDNARELLVLAGAELIDVIERGSPDLADFAALCLVCPAAQNLRPAPAVPELPEIAARYLSKRSVTRNKLSDEAVAEDLSATFTAAGPPLDKLAGEFRRLQLVVPQLQADLLIVAEETNMLWWLFSEFSRDLNQPWNELPVSVVALVSGKELAGLTRVLPGPIAAAAFLDKVLRSSKSELPEGVALADAVNETPVEWRAEYIKTTFPQELELIAPIRRGIRLSLSAAAKDSWRQLFADATLIPAASKAAPHVLAYQMFLEALLNRSFVLAG